MRQPKGFIVAMPVLVALVVVALAAAGGSYWYAQSKKQDAVRVDDKLSIGKPCKESNGFVSCDLIRNKSSRIGLLNLDVIATNLDPQKKEVTLDILWAGVEGFNGNKLETPNGGFNVDKEVHDGLLGNVSTIYRSVYLCTGEPDVSLTQGWRQVIDTSKGYSNFACQSRQQEQCIADRTEDKYYDERCDYEKVVLKEGIVACSSNFALLLKGQNFEFATIDAVAKRASQACGISLFDAADSTNISYTTNSNRNTNTNAIVNASTNTNTNSTVSTAGWKTYTSQKLEYSFKYPPTHTVTEATDGTVNLKDTSGEIVVSTRYRIEAVDGSLSTWFDTAPTGGATLGGRAGKKFSYKYCDGPGCGEKTIAYVVKHQIKLLGLEFVGDLEMSTLENTILSTFTFLDEAASWKTYTNTSHSFSFKYPTTWTTKSGTEDCSKTGTGTSRCYVASVEYKRSSTGYGADGDVFVNIYVRNGIKEALRAWFVANEELSKKKIDATLLEAQAGKVDVGPGYATQQFSNSDTILAGQTAIVQDIKATLPAYNEGPATTLKAYYFFKGGALYEIFISAPTGTRSEALISTANSLVQSLTFTK